MNHSMEAEIIRVRKWVISHVGLGFFYKLIMWNKVSDVSKTEKSLMCMLETTATNSLVTKGKLYFKRSSLQTFPKSLSTIAAISGFELPWILRESLVGPQTRSGFLKLPASETCGGFYRSQKASQKPPGLLIKLEMAANLNNKGVTYPQKCVCTNSPQAGWTCIFKKWVDTAARETKLVESSSNIVKYLDPRNMGIQNRHH